MTRRAGGAGNLVGMLLWTMLAAPLPGLCAEAESAAGAKGLGELSIEELMNIPITSASKKQQGLMETAAASYVLTREDIRRSGARSVPDLLRLVPGLSVARIDANKWAITARGFTGRFTNKLLVMIDGRSVYTPLFSGVFWESETTLLEDIERIEIIRGPGGTLWGANAVNGIINIITRHSRDTQGGLLVAGAGTEDKVIGSLRFGDTDGEGRFSRVWGSFVDRDESVDPGGVDAHDAWNFFQGGFRLDEETSSRDSLTVQGDFYDSDIRQRLLGPAFPPVPGGPTVRIIDTQDDVSGGNGMVKLKRRYSADSDMELAVYIDKTDRDNISLNQKRETLDLDFQRRKRLDASHELIWGVGFRTMSDELHPMERVIDVSPTSRRTRTYSAFVQDELRFGEEDRFRFTVGSKFQHNSYTGVELQPSARLLWLPDARHSVWVSASRAVRTPSRLEDDGRVNLRGFTVGILLPPGPAPTPVPALAALVGDRNFDSEELTALEAGYRVQVRDNLSLDIAAFYNMYDRLRTFEPRTPAIELVPAPAHVLVPFSVDNLLQGDTWGGELAVDWRATGSWRLRAGYSRLDIDLSLDPGSLDTTAFTAEGENPQNQAFIRSMWDVSSRVDFDAAVRYVDALPSISVQEYLALDLRLGYRPRDSVEIALVGRNLLEDRHAEFIERLLPSEQTEVERSLHGTVTWRF